MSIVTGALLGVLIGLRHAFEPDHLAAVSTMVGDGASARRGAAVGAWWGLGHTLALLAVAMILGLLGAQLADPVVDGLELVVAVMLVGLGVRAVRRALRLGGAGTPRVHRHRGVAHVHPTSARHVHLGGRALALRPLLVGTVHGLAGSGALTALVAARLPTLGAQLAYVLVFGLGSMLGMAAVSGLGAAVLGAAGAAWQRRLQGALGLVAVGIGVAWGVPLVDRLVA